MGNVANTETSSFPQSFAFFKNIRHFTGLGGSRADPAKCQPMPEPLGELVVYDSFRTDGSPDGTKWDFDLGTGVHGWGNGEKQYYTNDRDNSWVSNRTLKIRAKRSDRSEDVGGCEYTSARLVSKDSFLYGRFEVEARLPTARGSWAAVWMLPWGCPTDKKPETVKQWPVCGEIDIMEHVGFDCGNVHGTVHTGMFNHCKLTQLGRHLSVDDVGEFHKYTIDWTETHIDFGIDGIRYHRFENNGRGEQAWPFADKEKPFHLLLNVAIGGGWGGQQGVDEDAFEGNGQIMEVKAVRVTPIRTDSHKLA
jgi:beta-glucanase (GH16 family)